jgi:hypothetical protein
MDSYSSRSSSTARKLENAETEASRRGDYAKAKVLMCKAAEERAQELKSQKVERRLQKLLLVQSVQVSAMEERAKRIRQQAAARQNFEYSELLRKHG